MENSKYKNQDFLVSTLSDLLSIPSPSGYTDQIVHYVSQLLDKMGVQHELTRRGAIRATIDGEDKSTARAVVAHLDTLGAMISSIKNNGRLSVTPIGTWSSRFAEGARVTIFTDEGPKRGTMLPLKASGHTYNEEIDTQPVSWDQVELRVDTIADTKEELIEKGFQIGDFIAIDPQFEITESKFINSRHLDNKAGVAALLSAIKSVVDSKAKLPIKCHFLFTISEEVGSGASAVLHGDVSEMLSIDNSTVAPDQNSHQYGVTIAMKDSSGPFDYHLTHKILNICKENQILHARDVFKYYRCDAASAIEAGNDIRTALVCFACDASHGYERTHLNSLTELSKLLELYIKSHATFERDKLPLSDLTDFPNQPIVLDPTIRPQNIFPETYED